MTETYLALEISEHKVRYVVLEKKGKELTPKKTGVSRVQVGTSAPGVLGKFLKELISVQGIKVSRIFLSVNRRDTVIHQLNLAQTSRGDLKIIVPGEIEKIPSFADREFDYIYQNYELEKNKNKVVFAAISDDFLKYLIKEVEQTRIHCRALEISPLNFVGLLSTGEFSDSVQTLVILNDYTTYFIVFQNGRIKYFYTTNTGKENLFPAHLQKMDTRATSSWAEEMKRVLKSYLLENKQETISKIWLLWDQEGATSLDEHLRTELKLNAEALTPDKMPHLDKKALEGINPIYLLACVPAIYAASGQRPQYPLNHFFRNSQIKKTMK